MLKALIQPVTLFEQNASIIFCDETKKCAIVDPGGDIEILLNIAKEKELSPEKILLTHGHIDHAGGATEISEILNVEIHGPHIDDKFLLDGLQKQGEMFGLQSKNCNPDKWLDEGDVVRILRRTNDLLSQIPYCDAVSRQLRNNAKAALKLMDRFPVCEAQDINQTKGKNHEVVNPATERNH